MRDFTRNHPSPFRPLSEVPAATAAIRALDAVFEKTVGLTLGLLITLSLAIGLQTSLPHRSPLLTFFSALRAQAGRVLTRPVLSQPPAPVETVIVTAEARMSPRMLLERWQPYIAEASERFGLPAGWIRAVMQQESGGRTTLRGKPIVSRAGALGLMQLLPETYNDMRVRYRLGRDIANPRDNILAGAAYLRLLHKRYGFPFMFAAYNAGPKQFDRDVASGHFLPAETRAYVRNIVQSTTGAVKLRGKTYAGRAARLLNLPA